MAIAIEGGGREHGQVWPAGKGARPFIWLASAPLLWALSSHGQAPDARDTYPLRPVRVVVGLAPGGATDIQARLFARKLTESLVRPFVVENRPGAGGTIAYAIVANSPPDGHTLIASASGFSSTPLFYPNLQVDPVRDFAPLSLLVQAPFLLLVHPSVPARSVSELVALARSRPGTLDFGSSGHGTGTGLALDLFRIMAKIKLTHVPYRGIGPALLDTLAGQVHGLFGNPLSSLGYVKAGRLRALAVTSSRRALALPDLPTVSESGVPGYQSTTWHGWLAPAGIPSSIVNKINAELVKSARTPEVAAKLAAEGAEAVGSTPEQFARHLAAELESWQRVVKETGVKAE